MRVASLAVLALALAACATSTTVRLAPADAATALIAGAGLSMTREPPRSGGEDPLIIMRLSHPDGRVMSFEEANHAPYHLMAQAPGGPLAQAMGLFGDERPTLYGARSGETQGAPFLCPPEGPVSVGLYEGPAGGVEMVGLRQEFQFEPRGDGAYEALPFSPNMVCARLKFRRG